MVCLPKILVMDLSLENINFAMSKYGLPPFVERPAEIRMIMKKILITMLMLSALTTTDTMAQQKIVQTAGHDVLGEFAPEFAHLNDDVLFGEVWSRNDLLSLRDRSLVTMTSLISQGITDSSLLHHMQAAKKKRHNPSGGRRDNHPCGLLCRMAEGLGRFPSGQGGMERRCEG